MNSYRFILMIALFFSIAAPCSAVEKLLFQNELKAFENKLVQDFLETRNLSANFKFAHIDLNNDGDQELILKPTPCAAKKTPCQFYVLGRNASGDGFLELGKVHAFGLSVAEVGPAGVRRLRAYQSTLNDFEYNLYVWNALKSEYQMTEKKE